MSEEEIKQIKISIINNNLNCIASGVTVVTNPINVFFPISVCLTNLQTNRLLNQYIKLLEENKKKETNQEVD